MKVFVTGPTGFIGSRFVESLKKDGYEVIGLTRSEDSAQKLTALGATPLRGTLEDLDVLEKGAKEADAIVHLAFDHSKLGTSRYAEACDEDLNAVKSFAKAIKGTNKPLLVTSGTISGNKDGKRSAEDLFELAPELPRGNTELFCKQIGEEGINVKIVRLPQVHDTERWGLLSFFLPAFKKAGNAVYLDTGALGVAAVHVGDVVNGYVKILHDKSKPGTVFHLVAEECVKQKDYCEAFSTRFELPAKSVTSEELSEKLGPLALFMSIDLSAKSDFTKERLSWHPKGPPLLKDILESTL